MIKSIVMAASAAFFVSGVALGAPSASPIEDTPSVTPGIEECDRFDEFALGLIGVGGRVGWVAETPGESFSALAGIVYDGKVYVAKLRGACLVEILDFGKAR